MEFIASGERFKPKEVGYFSPDLAVAPEIKDGEIGYIATGLKDPALVKIGDTVLAHEQRADDGSAIRKNLRLQVIASRGRWFSSLSIPTAPRNLTI